MRWAGRMAGMSTAPKRRWFSVSPWRATLVLFLESLGPAVADDAGRKAQEDDIREAVFRQSFSEHKNETVFFIGIQSAEKRASPDPSDEFLKRFADTKLKIRKESQAGESRIGEVADPDNGGSAVRLFIGTITWDSDTDVSVKGGHYKNPLDASGSTYTLKKGNDGWKVVKVERRWVA